jgi:hypothetical protein
MLGTIFMVLGIILAVLWLIFVIKGLMVKVEIAESRLIFVIICLMAVIGVYCSFIVITNCTETTYLESLKKINFVQANRLHYLVTKLEFILVIGFIAYGVQFILSKVMRKRNQKEIEKNSSSNEKWNI